MRILAPVLIAVLLAATIAGSQAFAVQPYVGGYPDTTTITKHNQYTGKTNFSGTTTVTPRDDWITSVFSSATYASSSATSPTTWVHQQGVTLKADNNIRGIFQIYHGITCAYSPNCPGDIGSDLGNYGTGSADIAYVYTTFYTNGTPLKTNFYYEPHTNSGNVVIVPIRVYDPVANGDPTTKYAVGTFYQNINVGGTLINTKFKLYQFAVEGGSVGSGEISQTWLVKQYELTYNGAVALSGIPARSTAAITDKDNGSYITPYTKGDGTTGRVMVGAADYTNAGASYNLNDGTIPKGEVDWKKSATHISGGTALWS
ncbi:MAG TPA: hypothetical protein VFA69_06215 [Candidatus Nitrosotalea sp.]|nr:hypothetical protein [Candidatus Nitrosotalea sp.]